MIEHVGMYIFRMQIVVIFRAVSIAESGAARLSSRVFNPFTRWGCPGNKYRSFNTQLIGLL